MPEVQDVFREYGQLFRDNNKLPLHHLKAMSSIEFCRTSSLGAHVDTCSDCGHTHISYNSCRNRHCPKCQSLAKEQWLNKQQQNLLSTHYFHVVFTLPDELRPIALRNQKSIYSLLFKAVSETLLDLTKDPKHLGARIGFSAILHTWGQNLMFHPHIHCIVPGGGLAFDNKRFIQARKKYLIHVKVLARVFRGKFLSYLKQMYFNDELEFVGEIDYLSSTTLFKSLLDDLYNKDWNVYAKANFKNSNKVLKYLGNYTHRVAISNHRIVKVDAGQVTFKWKDYKDGNKQKVMTLDALEFIRRFLLHILPFKFVKIRHYGFLSNRCRSTKVQLCKILIERLTGRIHPKVILLDTKQLIFKMTAIDITFCPICKKGHMIRKPFFASLALNSS